MAVKTITIDIDAYKILKANKRGKESFSQVIKRKLKKNKSAANLLKNVAKIAFSEQTLANIDNMIKNRKKSYPDSPIINGKS